MAYYFAFLPPSYPYFANADTFYLQTASLQDTLAKKDIEMQGMEERYKKYIEKAKSVIKTLDPKQNPNAAPEMSALRNQLGEKDRLIETLEQV